MIEKRSQRPGASAEVSLFVPRALYPSKAPRQVWVLEFGRNPTTDYYIVPRCAAPDGVPYQIIDVTRTDPAMLEIPPATFIIIVRYVTGSWLRHLMAHRSRLAGVAYFLDDDLPAALWKRDLPVRYRYKILRYFLVHRRALSALCSNIWVSTQYLAEKYGIDSSFVLKPLPLVADDRGETQLTYFYEGTASHHAEFRWLLEVVARVQAKTAHLTFVTVGGREVRRIFAGIPRTLCIHPVDWETYRRSFSVFRHDIGLAPLMDSGFNRARSPTKFFDITRFGAAGIYSNAPPYSGFIRSGIDGLLVPNHPADWSAAIIDLADSKQHRSKLLANARARLDQSSREPQALPTRLR